MTSPLIWAAAFGALTFLCMIVGLLGWAMGEAAQTSPTARRVSKTGGSYDHWVWETVADNVTVPNDASAIDELVGSGARS